MQWDPQEIVDQRIADWRSSVAHVLDLSRLELSEIPPQVMGPAGKGVPIKKLLLACNKLTSFPVALSESHPELQVLELSANSFSEDKHNNEELLEALSRCKELTEFSFAEGKLHSPLRLVVCLSSLPLMTVLDLRKLSLALMWVKHWLVSLKV